MPTLNLFVASVGKVVPLETCPPGTLVDASNGFCLDCFGDSACSLQQWRGMSRLATLFAVDGNTWHYTGRDFCYVIFSWDWRQFKEARQAFQNVADIHFDFSERCYLDEAMLRLRSVLNDRAWASVADKAETFGIRNTFRKFLSAQDPAYEGEPHADVLQRLGLNAWFAEKYSQKMTRFGKGQTHRAMAMWCVSQVIKPRVGRLVGDDVDIYDPETHFVQTPQQRARLVISNLNIMPHNDDMLQTLPENLDTLVPPTTGRVRIYHGTTLEGATEITQSRILPGCAEGVAGAACYFTKSASVAMYRAALLGDEYGVVLFYDLPCELIVKAVVCEDEVSEHDGKHGAQWDDIILFPNAVYGDSLDQGGVQHCLVACEDSVVDPYLTAVWKFLV